MAKVMLVEDDNSLRQIYADRLAAEGYQILTAKDGEEALAMAIKERPDLIIADIMMPKVSGFDMLDILRSTTETKDTKIIMMTALSQAEDKVRAEKLGADKYLVKSQVTLEDVAREAAEMLKGQEEAENAAAAKMVGQTPQQTTAAQPTPTQSTTQPSTEPTPEPQSSPITPAAEQAAPAQNHQPNEPTSEPPVAPPTTEKPQPETTTPSSTTIPVVAPPPESDTQPEPVAPNMPPNPAAGNAPDPASQSNSTPPPSSSNNPTNTDQASAAAKNISLTTDEEEAVMKNQIDEFIASNPTLSATADGEPTPDTRSEQATRKQITVTDHNEQTTENPPTKNDNQEKAIKATEEAIDGMLDGMDDEKNQLNPGSTDTEKTPSQPEQKKNQLLDKENDDSPKAGGGESMKHTKRIEPDADLTITAPNLNELLAKEAEQNPVTPAVGSEIVPGGGSLSQLRDNHQNPVPQQQNLAPSTSADSLGEKQGSNTEPADPNNISL